MHRALTIRCGDCASYDNDHGYLWATMQRADLASGQKALFLAGEPLVAARGSIYGPEPAPVEICLLESRWRGDSLEELKTAYLSASDAVTHELEDHCPDHLKAVARKNIRQVIDECGSLKPTFVRTATAHDPAILADLEAIVCPQPLWRDAAQGREHRRDRNVSTIC